MRKSRKLTRLLLVVAIALPLIARAAPAQADDLVCVNVLTVYVQGNPHPLADPPICEVSNSYFTVPTEIGEEPSTCSPEPLGAAKVCFYIVVNTPL